MVFLVPDDKKVVLSEDVRVEFFYGSTVFKKVLSSTGAYHILLMRMLCVAGFLSYLVQHPFCAHG